MLQARPHHQLFDTRRGQFIVGKVKVFVLTKALGILQSDIVSVATIDRHNRSATEAEVVLQCDACAVDLAFVGQTAQLPV